MIDAFRQFHRAEDGDPTFRTEARIVYNARNLCVMVRAHDPHPDSILSLLSRRDVVHLLDRNLSVSARI